MGFELFHNSWMDELSQLVEQLSQAPYYPPVTEEHHHHLRLLVHKTLSHYVQYYNAKSSYAAVHDPLPFFSPPWATSLERSVHWIGGWRPAIAFHLVYTESSIRFEPHVVDILRGFRNGDLGDLSPVQFRRVSQLQCEIVEMENRIADDFCVWQDGIALDVVGIYRNVDRNMERLGKVLERADQLRLRTIEGLVDVLTPQQAAEFLAAAAQLCFGIREWGVEQDRRRSMQHDQHQLQTNISHINGITNNG